MKIKKRCIRIPMMALMASLLALIVVLISIFFIPLRAHADVIFGWEMNEFYRKHKNDRVDVYAYCHANERINGYDAPGDKKPGGHIKKGRRFYTAALWKDKNGDWWAIAEVDYDTGLWFRLSELYLDYSADLFEEDYADRFYTGERVVFDKEKNLYLYNYPCAASCRLFRLSPDNLDKENYQPDTFFRDDENRVWGLIREDDRKSWVCVDDPYTELMGDDRYARDISALSLAGETPKSGKDRSGRDRSRISTDGSGDTDLSTGVIVAAVGVLAVVWGVAVAIVIFIIRKKNRKTSV